MDSDKYETGTYRILELKDYSPQQTLDGVKFECECCNRPILFAEVIDGYECPCGAKFRSPMVLGNFEEAW